jgi:hypothetical protein
MENIKLSKFKADSYVVRALEEEGYAEEKENLRIRTFLNEGYISYYAQEFIYYGGERTQKILPLSLKNYIYLLKEGLSLDGYDNLMVSPRIKGNDVSYIISASVVSYDRLPSHNLTKIKRMDQ